MRVHIVARGGFLQRLASLDISTIRGMQRVSPSDAWWVLLSGCSPIDSQARICTLHLVLLVELVICRLSYTEEVTFSDPSPRIRGPIITPCRQNGASISQAAVLRSGCTDAARSPTPLPLYEQLHYLGLLTGLLN